MKRICIFLVSVACLVSNSVVVAEENQTSRVVSVFLSQSFINEQLKKFVHSKMVHELQVEFDSTGSQIFLRGLLQVPLEELRAMNLEPHAGDFRFQLTVKPSITREGYFVLEFPLNQTFFYPADSKNPKQDEIVVPVQLLSLGLASVRGYLAALSGDFSSFDRRDAKLKALSHSLSRMIKSEKNADAKDQLQTELRSVQIQLEAMPIERKQLEAVAKSVEHIMGFTGEKELNLNNELGARKNAIILKLKVSQLTPYLADVDLEGLRFHHDEKEGQGENYMIIDIQAKMAAGFTAHKPTRMLTSRLQNPAALILRLNQQLFESETLVKAEKKAAKDKVANLKTSFEDDGLHLSGDWKGFWITIPFDTVVDLKSKAIDSFEVRVREIRIAGIDLEFLSQYVLDAVQAKLNKALNGLCEFESLGVQSDNSRALRVKVSPTKLVPAFPDLHLLDVEMHQGALVMRVGHP